VDPFFRILKAKTREKAPVWVEEKAKERPFEGLGWAEEIRKKGFFDRLL